MSYSEKDIRRFLAACKASEKTDANLVPVSLTQQEIDQVYEDRTNAMIERLSKLEAQASGGRDVAGDVAYQTLHRRCKQIEDHATPECRARIDAALIKILRERGMWDA